MLKNLSSLPRTVWLLGLVSFFNDSASELVYPLIPIYLASVFMTGPGALGIIEGIAEATGSLLKLFSGMIADRMHSTKYWVVGGYGLAAIGRPLLALASSWPVVIFLRFSDRVGKGLRTAPRDAMLALSVDDGRRGLAFGLHRAMDNAGAVIGPLAAAVLLAMHLPIREILLWTLIPGFITVILALAVKAPPRNLPGNPGVFSWNLRTFPRPFRRYLFTLALFTLGNSSNMFLLLRAREMGLPEYQVAMLWALVAFTASLFSTPLSSLSDRIGRSRLITAGWIVYGIFYVILGWNGSITWILWPLFAFYGLFMAATEGAEKALVADLASDRSLLGTAYGWFNLTAGAMLLPASMLFGWLWQSIHPLFAFGFSASCAAIAAFLLNFWVFQSE